MSLESDYLEAFETHSPEGIRSAIAAGASATELIKGKRPIDILIEMYSRSPKFGECLRVMLDAGATIDNPLLQAVLLDDPSSLPGDRQRLQEKLSFVSAYTCCKGVSALHVCAEFNSIRCAEALIRAGVDLDARADLDDDGFGGQTPIFHAVNSNQNHCRPVMEMLVDAGANLDVRVKGLLWGESFDWETLIFDVTPISYAQCGLYQQVHRNEFHIYSNIEYMYRFRYGTVPPVRNVPNKYLA